MALFCLGDLTPAAPRFAKDIPVAQDQAARLEHLLSLLERRLQAAFEQFVQQATDAAVVEQVADLLERGDVQGALDVIEPYIRQMGAVVPQLYQTGAIAETAALVEQLLPLRPTIGISFDVGNPEAAALMRRNQLEFVTAFTDSQAAATREALATGLDQGQGFTAAARAFRNSIGLADNQVRAVANFRRLLERGSAEALDRVLRDRRFDASVRAAVEGRRPLTTAQIDRMVARYAERQLASRADTIARTESLKILSEAQEMAFAQTMRDAGLGPEDVEQSWLTTMDGRERLTHGIMNGQVQPYGTPFESPSGARLRYPGDPSAPAEEVINCRCRRVFRIILGAAGRIAA